MKHSLPWEAIALEGLELPVDRNEMSGGYPPLACASVGALRRAWITFSVKQDGALVLNKSVR